MRAVLLALLLAACTPKAGKPDVLGAGQSIAVATALDALNDPTQIVAPDRLDKALAKRLGDRNLTVSAPGALPFEFADARSTDVRLQALADAAETDLVLLMEAKPVFDSQIAGRFRWNVAVTATLAARSDLSGARSYEWDIPVFLQFYHQQESEALAEATPMIERNLRGALDEFIGGL